MSWKQFQGVFNRRYFSDVVRKSKRDEFVGLMQGKSTVAEYVHTFDRLACFAPELVSSDQTRRDKFIGGLNSMIDRDVGITLSLVKTTYAQAINRALYAEEAEERIARELAVRREHRRTIRNTSSQDGGGLSKLKRKNAESSISGGMQKLKGDWRNYPFCDECRRYHYGGCRPRSCYRCGSQDHLRKDCPQLTSKSRKAVGAVATTKMVALTEAEAKDNKV